MSRKLTNEIIDQRLISNNSNIVRKEQYVSAHVKISWECSKCGNIWRSTYANISRGRGCPICAINKNKKRNTFTNEYVDKRLKINNKNIKRIDDYVTARHPIKWKCFICEHVWMASPDKVLHNTGCPNCANNRRKLTNDIIDSRILSANRNIIRLGDYVNIKIKIRWRCNRNHTWLASPDRVLSGTRCPKCNMIGNYRLSLNDEKLQEITTLYVVRFISKTTNIKFLKIGITKNTISQRLSRYKKNYNIKILYAAKLSLLECINIEQKTIHEMKSYQYIPEGKFGGKTECFIDIPEVEDHILQLLE